MDHSGFELQAASAYTGWQILEAGVRGSGSLDDKRIAEWLKKNRAVTLIGRVRFDGPNNDGDDSTKSSSSRGEPLSTLTVCDLAGCPTKVH